MRHLAIAALIVSGSLSAAAAEPDFGAWVEKHRARWRVPGVAAAVVRADQPPRVFASGLCDIERNVACTADSEFHIGSNTKFFTGLLAALLVAEEKVTLDDPVIDAWPEFRLSDERWTKVTLRDLLSQRSGIASIEWPYYWQPSLTRKDYLERLAHVPMGAAFRSRFHYSNANFVAAGAYLERRTGVSWEDLLRSRILKPLGMSRTGFDVPRKTRGYWHDKQQVRHLFPAMHVKANGPAGTIVSTAADTAKFLQLILGDGIWRGKELVPPIALRIATTPPIGVGYDNRFYGAPGGSAFGIFTAAFRGQRIWYHGGGYGGYSSFLAVLPESKLAVAVLCNRNRTQFAEAVSLALLDLLRGHDADELMRQWKQVEDERHEERVPDVVIKPTRAWPEYVGRYAHPAWGSFDVVQAGDGLRIRYGSLDAPLEHYTRDTFSFESAPQWERMLLRFDSDFEGRVDGFSLKDGVNHKPMQFRRE